MLLDVLASTHLCVCLLRLAALWDGDQPPYNHLHPVQKAAMQGTKAEQLFSFGSGGIWGQLPPPSSSSSFFLLSSFWETWLAIQCLMEAALPSQFACKVLIVIVATTALFLGRCLKELRK